MLSIWVQSDFILKGRRHVAHRGPQRPFIHQRGASESPSRNSRRSCTSQLLASFSMLEKLHSWMIPECDVVVLHMVPFYATRVFPEKDPPMIKIILGFQRTEIIVI